MLKVKSFFISEWCYDSVLSMRIRVLVFVCLQAMYLVKLVWTCPIAGTIGTFGWININPWMPSDVLPPSQSYPGRYR